MLAPMEIGRVDLQVSEILLELQLLLLHTLLMRILELVIVGWAGVVMLMVLMHHLLRR